MDTKPEIYEMKPEPDFYKVKPELDLYKTKPEQDFYKAKPEPDFYEAMPDGDHEFKMDISEVFSNGDQLARPMVSASSSSGNQNQKTRKEPAAEEGALTWRLYTKSTVKPKYTFEDENSDDDSDQEKRRKHKKARKNRKHSSAMAKICPFCKEAFPFMTQAQKKSYGAHYSGHNLSEYPCPFEHCKMGFKTALALLKHSNRCHISLDAFVCSACKVPYKNQTLLNKHVCYLP